MEKATMARRLVFAIFDTELLMHKAPCGRTRRGDRLGLSPRSPIRANCLNLNQKKCKFLYGSDHRVGHVWPCSITAYVLACLVLSIVRCLYRSQKPLGVADAMIEASYTIKKLEQE
jgi:hypothetical protein